MNTNQFTSHADMVAAAQSIEPGSPMHLELIEHLRLNPEDRWNAERAEQVTDPELIGRLYLSIVVDVPRDALVAPEWAQLEQSSIDDMTGDTHLPVCDWGRLLYKDEFAEVTRTREDVYDPDTDSVRIGDEKIRLWLDGENVEVDAATLRKIAAGLLNAADQVDFAADGARA